MKPIKCPNCGKNMTHSHCNIRGIAWMECATINGCGVCGPKVLILKGMDAAARIAARLTREWIARMEADKSGRWIDGYNEGWEEAKKDVHNTHDACVHQDGWIKGNRAAVSEMRVIIEKIEASMKRVEEGGK